MTDVASTGVVLQQQLVRLVAQSCRLGDGRIALRNQYPSVLQLHLRS